ncbi:hypothetical protein B0H11DRAFT_1981586 [Mycena galericulata]|nr:hypothetical protein B0H11DRAFT_1981586 [Mycena galericulata]
MDALKYWFFDLIPHQLFAKLQDTKADLTGRTLIVTGSNTGLGLALAIRLARLNPAQLILAVRDLKKGDAAKENIIAQTGFAGSLEVWELDMAEFESVKKFAERANSTLERLDGAVLNAGINVLKWGLTPDGWERTLQINALSTGLLGVLLLPLLQATTRLPAPHPNASQLLPHLTFTGSTIMYIAEFAQKSAPKILQAMNDEFQSNLFDRYHTTKLFDLFLARKIAALPQAQGVVVNAVCPGLCSSELARDIEIPAFIIYILSLLAWTTTKGSLNMLYALLTPTGPGEFVSCCRVREPPSWSRSPEGLRVQEQVWSEMLEVWKEVSPELSGIVV